MRASNAGQAAVVDKLLQHYAEVDMQDSVSVALWLHVC